MYNLTPSQCDRVLVFAVVLAIECQLNAEYKGKGKGLSTCYSAAYRD